jgi:hypothetical protein
LVVANVRHCLLLRAAFQATHGFSIGPSSMRDCATL